MSNIKWVLKYQQTVINRDFARVKSTHTQEFEDLHRAEDVKEAMDLGMYDTADEDGTARYYHGATLVGVEEEV